MSHTTPWRATAGLLLALGLAACGATDPTDAGTTDDTPTTAATPTATETGAATADDDPTGSADAAEGFPVTVSHDGGEVTLPAAPQRIVSLSPAATEMLFAIDAGDQVTAVDDLSGYPPETPVVEGLSAFDPNVEAVLELDPDLVVLSDDRNDLVAGLDAVDVPTLLYGSAATLEDSYRQIEQIGAATGNAAEADDLVASIRAELAALADGAAGEGLTYYHELSDDLYSVTSTTFIGEIYGLFGLTSIADAADEDGEAFGFPQLSAEYLVEQDPDLVFLACTEFCDTDAASFGAREGFGDLQAVQEGDVVELDDDIASRWGPRVVDFADSIADALADRGE